MGDESTHLNMPADEKDPDKTEVMADGGPDLDSSKVKFINGGADAQVDLGPAGDGQFVGMSKEELMKYANDPYWVRVRWVMLILFWLAWFAMLAAAIVIIILAPKCAPRPNLQWWQKSTMYQVYPRSFKDTNKDGFGDLQGVHDNLGYLKDKLNVSAVWLNSIYPSPNKDWGFDISDYKGIHSDFGTMDDFSSLKTAMHKKGMKLVMDFVPNHTSRNHTWFINSEANEEEFAAYYIWHPGKPSAGGGRNDPPNNWLSVFGGSAWTWSDKRSAYYYHQFSAEQPDLNLTNPAVQNELKDVLRFWMEKGVDGFRVDAAAHLVESSNLNEDEPPSQKGGAEGEYESLSHTLTTFQPGSYELVSDWRVLLDEVSDKTEKYRFLMVEAYGTPNETQNFYEYKGRKGADMPSNMNLINLEKDCSAHCVHDLVENWMSTMPEGRWANWVLGNHDRSRVATRVGDELVNAANMLLLTLPGTPVVYYGDEIGMVDGDISYSDTRDPIGIKAGEANYKKVSRDPERTPMQWSSDDFAGFTEGDKPWLPVNVDFQDRNVKSQQAHGAGMTKLEVFQSLTLLRQEPSFQWGELHYSVINDDIFSFVRQAKGFPGFLVAINFGIKSSTVDFRGAKVPSEGVVAATTANFDPSFAQDFKVGTEVPLGNLVLRPGEGVIFKWKPEALES